MWVFGKVRYLELLLLLLRWCLASFHACFGWDRSLIRVVACLTCFIHLMHILAHGYMFVILFWSLCEDSLLFCKSWHGDGYNCSNTSLYALWSTLILILMHNIYFFSWFAVVGFIAKGGEYVHKIGRTLTNRVDERRTHDNWISKGESFHWEG
jgi:hypothetical protein